MPPRPARATKKLPLEQIRLEFQPSAHLIDEVVHELAVATAAGRIIPPVRVFFDGESYWLADGFHRLAAARQCGRQEIEADVVDGTYADMEAEFREMLAEIKRTLGTKPRP